MALKWALVKKTIIDRDSQCVFCKAKIDLSVDHIIPRGWRGSINGANNLRVLCQTCHRAKEKIERKLQRDVMQERLTVTQAKEYITNWDLNYRNPIRQKPSGIILPTKTKWKKEIHLKLRLPFTRLRILITLILQKRFPCSPIDKELSEVPLDGGSLSG